MSFFSGKKLLLFGFIFVLLIAIPVTVYLVSQQQKTKSNATAATTLSFSPVTQTVAKGGTTTFDLYVDPSSGNQVSSIKVLLSYDATKLATTSAGLQIDSWTAADGTPFTPAIFEKPTYGPGTISFAISVGTSPQNVITTRTKIATVTFNAVAPTDPGVPTEVTFGNQSQVLNLGNASAEPGENILSNTSSGKVTITEATTTSTPTTTATMTPSPTTSITQTPTNTPTPTVTGISNNGLTCSNLALDPGGSGTVPFSVNLTATGNSTGSAITKVSFDFGDGNAQDVSDSGGIGTSSVSVLISHTYATSGTFNATATITDENDNVSSGGCTATIKVIDQTTQTPTAIAPSPLAPTGPSGIITIGAIGVMLTFIGAILLLAL